MITVSLMGGLGNQLFQWAFGKALYMRGHNVQYDVSFYDSTKDRHVAVDFLGLGWTKGRPGAQIHEHGLRYNRTYFENAGGEQTFIGYWQTEQYFHDIAYNIRQHFRASLVPSLESHCKAVEITGKRNSVAVHVRRGDYLTPHTQAFHGVLDIHYYKQAISLTRECLFDPYFYIFSDDTAYVSQAFEFLGDRHEVINNSRHEREDMWLMSKCQHAVIANSSFSWWGAWLNDDNFDRIVVAPRNWFAVGPDQADATDITPWRWIRL